MPLSWLGCRFRTRNSASVYHGTGKCQRLSAAAPKPPHVLTTEIEGRRLFYRLTRSIICRSSGREETIRLRRHVHNQQGLLRFGNRRIPRYRIAKSTVQRILKLMREP